MEHSTIPLVVLSTLALGPSAWAGDCLDGEAVAVRDLERITAGQTNLGHTEAHCLTLTYHFSTNRWAGPRAAKVFSKKRKSRYRKRMRRACARAFRSKIQKGVELCLEVLATHGITRVGAHDVLALQKKYLPKGYAPKYLAALGDSRAVPLLIERFRAIEVRQQRKDYGGRRNRFTRNRDQEAKIAILNAMWHLVDPGSRSFLQAVISDDPDPLIRERAKRTLERVVGEQT